jgi:hypothetical protein
LRNAARFIDMADSFAMADPTVLLPTYEAEGGNAWWNGTYQRGDSLTDGFAFCPYDCGTLEWHNWVSGYASAAFDPVLLQYQTATR